MSEIEELREYLKIKEAQVIELQIKLLDSRIINLETANVDKEGRLRAVETSRTRFETLAWLAFGGGALSLINIITIWIK